MRLRHQRDSGGRTLWIYLCRDEAPARPARGLAADGEDVVAHYLRDDMDRPARLYLAEPKGDTDGGSDEGTWAEVGERTMPGLYRLDVPAALLAAGSTVLHLSLRAADVRPVAVEIELVAYDPYDGVGIGLDGFTKAVRHQNLTSILEHIMPPSVKDLVQRRRTS